MIDDQFINFQEYRTDMANNTFLQNVSILVGDINISGIPGVHTYTNSAPGVSFFTGILNDSGNVVMVGKAFVTSQTSFKGTSVRYQMLLPIPNASMRWYFFRDPNDECPAGLGLGQVGDSIIQGYVFVANSTTPIVNAYVTAGANASYTTSAGFYNFTVPGGITYDIVSIKDGYITNVSSANTSIGATTKLNLTMARFFGYGVPNASILGYARDNSTDLPLANVTVTVKGIIVLTNASGNYSINASSGLQTITASKLGYENIIGIVNLSSNQNLTFIFNMTPFSGGVFGEQVFNGTVFGYSHDNDTGAILPNVTVILAGDSISTNGSGYYNKSTYSGYSTIVALKSGYNLYTQNITVPLASSLLHNFSLEPLSEAAAQAGTLHVQVRDSSGSIAAATVSILGYTNTTNTTGGAGFLNVDEGTHVIASTKTGYANFIGQVNISPNAVNRYNITMETVTESGLGAGSGAG